MSALSKLIRRSIVRSLLKEIQHENLSHFAKIEKLLQGKIRSQSETRSAHENAVTVTEEFDLIITHNEICAKHGTGVLLKRLFGDSDSVINIRSMTHFDEESIGRVRMELRHHDESRAESFMSVADALRPYRIRRILCVPFYRDCVITAITAQALYNVPMCLFLMDDQNIHQSEIPNELMEELIDRSSLRLAIGPDMRDAYEAKFGRKFWILPPTIPDHLILRGESGPSSSRSSLKCALVGNIWSAGVLESMQTLSRQSGILIDWYGNTPVHMISYDEKKLAVDGIQCKGSFSEDALQSLLAEYAFTIVPSASSDLDESHEWLAALSLPSRIPFLMAAARIPVLVISDKETPATRFVRDFGIGMVCSYKLESFKAAVELISSPDRQQQFRTAAAVAAPAFSSEGIGEWIWKSLAKGVPVDRRFENLFKRTSEVTPPWIDSPVPKGIWWEFHETFRALCRLQEAGFTPDFVIDVGASTGLWSDMCQQVFPEARYTLIDPLMSSYRKRSSWHYDQHPEFECEEAAVSNQKGRMDFHVSDDMYGSSLMSDVTDGRTYEKISVPVITLDDLAARKRYAGSGLLKLDVQFAEHLAIEGATRLLDQITIILVELTFEQQSKEARTFLEMINWLDQLGYRYFDQSGGWRLPKNGIPVQQDVVFVKKGHLLS